MAFIPATPLTATSLISTSPRHSNLLCKQSNKSVVRMSADDVVDTYFPVYQRNRAPTIVITPPEESVSISMEPISSFQTVDDDVGPLLDYSDPDAFVPDKPVPPSPISWPSGDGRSDPDFKGVKARFDQPNLKQYGPFPDFFKRSCDG